MISKSGFPGGTHDKIAGYYLTASEVSKLCKEEAIYNSAFLANSEEYS